MTAGEYCNREVVITEQDTSVTKAAMLMREFHVGSLVVVQQQDNLNIPVGIVSDRDLIIEVIAQQVPVESVTLNDVMSRNLVSVGEQETLIDTLQLMLKRGVRRVLVVDGQGSLQGLLTADDAIELMAESMSDLAKVVSQELKQEVNKRP
ncbi:MAG: CBS domain-containing protein [Gammaproteobacteria bacterium]|nr:CBS domain-containing protein [Gammaproteobacteria bacterium]